MFFERLNLEINKSKELAELIRAKGEVQNITPYAYNGVMAGVDCGVLTLSFQGMDLIALKPALDLFTYKNSKIESYKFLPRKIPFVKLESTSSDGYAFSIFKSLYRLKEEIQLGISAVEIGANMLLMDGSIIIQLADKPNFESEAFPLYAEVCALYARLYEICTKRNCLLVGVVKDSKGKRFSKHYSETFSFQFPSQDSILMHELLKPMQRTKCVSYAKDPSTHSLVTDVGAQGQKIHSFHCRFAKDSPMRIDFLALEKTNENETANEITSALAGISIAAHYGYPAVLINADLRSVISKTEFELAIGQKTLIYLRKYNQRRDERPFR